MKKKLYYSSYILMRIVCWFVLGLFVAFPLKHLFGNINDGVLFQQNVGVVFSMIGGFFLGLYHIIIEE